MKFDEQYTQSTTDRKLFSIVKRTGNLRALDFSEFPSSVVSNFVIRCFILQNPLLRFINIASCVCVTPFAFTNLSLTNLEVLIMNWCPYIDKRCLDELQKSPIKVLSLAGLPGINEEFLLTAADYYPDLACLNISHCYGLTDRALRKLRKFESLECVRISRDMNVSEKYLHYIETRCKKLRKVTVVNDGPNCFKRIHYLSSSYHFRKEYLKPDLQWMAPYLS